MDWEMYQIARLEWEEQEKKAHGLNWAKSSAIEQARQTLYKAIPKNGVWFVMTDGMAVKREGAATLAYPVDLMIRHISQIAEDGSIIEPIQFTVLQEDEDDKPF